MPTVHLYPWEAGDQRWLIAARYMTDAGWSNVSDFVRQMELDNPGIVDWRAVAPGTRVTLSYLTN